MSEPRMTRLAEHLLKAKVVDEFQMRSALAEQAKWGTRLTKVIHEMRLVPENKIVAALAHACHLQPVDLTAVPADAAALKKLDPEFCEEKGVFPCALKDQGKTLFLAMCDPTDFATTEDVEKKTRCRLKLLVAGELALATAVKRCYRDANPRTRSVAPQIAQSIDLSPASTGEFTDAHGEVLGKMRSEPRKLAPPVPVAMNTPNADQLDSLFDFVPETLNAEERGRLEAIKQNQSRGNLILRVVLELCVEKGLLTADDVNRLKL